METYFKNLTPEEGTKEKLYQDLKLLLQDGQALLSATGSGVARKSMQELKELSEKIKVTCEKLKEQTVRCAQATDRSIRAHPYRSIGVAFAVGVVVGVLVNRHYRNKD